ncbi:MAG TPA: hypothetical protein VHN36_20800, partial [Ilumatobacteraceae bacterium]|nr:hypothetical protein [Ilumatobacteraceae bacterium]
MMRAYDPRGMHWRHPFGDLEVALVALAAVMGVWTQSPAWVGAVAAGSLLARRRPVLLLVCLVFGLAGVWRSRVTWDGATPRHLGHYTGWVPVVGDPAPFNNGLRVTVEIDGERFDAWAYGSSRRRLLDRQAGEFVYVDGERRPQTSNVRRPRLRHVVGRFDLQVVGDPAPFNNGLRVTVEIDDERFDAWAYGSSRRRLLDRQAGDFVYVDGERRPQTSNVRRARLRHVVGRFDLQVVGDWREGSPLYRT